jgi:hypothetical protein
MIVLYLSSDSSIAAAIAASDAQRQLAASQARGQVVDLGDSPSRLQAIPSQGSGLIVDKFV